MTSILPPTAEELRERERVERLIREQMQGTLGNESRAAAKRKAKIEKFRNTFRDKAFNSGKFKAAAEHAQQMARFDAMPARWKMVARPPSPSKEAAQQMATIQQRFNTVVRRDMKTDLAAIDKFQKRSRQYEHDLRLKHDKRYRPNRGRGIFGFFNRPEDREGFRTWAAQHDPEFYKRQQRFLKKYGEDPQRYSSMIPGLGGRRDLREEAAFSRQFINRAEYDKSRRDAWNRYNQWKRKQQAPRTPYGPIRSTGLTPPDWSMPHYRLQPKVTPISQPEQDKLWAKYRKDQAQAPAPRKKPKYNQAAYLAGLQNAPMTMGQKLKPQQGIYKPYAKGGGVRKPKYNKKG